MDCHDYTTSPSGRKKGQHLQREDRGVIQFLKRLGFSNRGIARAIGCSPSTIANELRRGTPPRKSNKGRAPGYSAKRGQADYKANRQRCRRHRKIMHCAAFANWVTKQFREHKWSPDACVGYARLHGLFPAGEMVCTGTLYNEIRAYSSPLALTELPEALKRKPSTIRSHVNKRVYGSSISERPEVASMRIEEGHWEGDTVVGKRNGKEAVVFSLLEKKTQNYIAMRIPAKTKEAVMAAMFQLKEEYGDLFSEVFKTITLDNGTEFSDFVKVEAWGTQVFFAHPYTSWERPQNERHNGLFRAFVPKGTSIETCTAEFILASADELNGRPRKKLDYRTPEELFETFLDTVFAA